MRYAHHPVLAKGYVDRVDVSFKDRRVATHERLWGKAGASFEPVHYRALLERKPGALDHARPLEGWELPECSAVLRRRLEGEQEEEGEGTREYIRALRLLKSCSRSARLLVQRRHCGVSETWALRCRSLSWSAV